MKKILSQLQELNNAIAEKSNRSKEKSIKDILNESNWAGELDKFITDNKANYDPNFILFTKAPTDLWIKAIRNSNAADIDEFRHILALLYPTDYYRTLVYWNDIPILKDIADAIIPEDSKDLIIKANLGYLKKQIEAIIEKYQKK